VQPRPPAPVSKESLAALIEESRRNKRLCPLPVKWLELDAMLRRAAPPGATSHLAPPPGTAEWAKSSALAKRLMVRNAIDWAEDYSLVDPMLQFLRGLAEDQWHHGE
jgi:hypothetical protein